MFSNLKHRLQKTLSMHSRTRTNPRSGTKLCSQGAALRVESLEQRLMLDGDGILTGQDAYFSLSFAPDGTEIAEQVSTLGATFGTLAGTTSWRNTILEAFQTWAAQTNADIGLVADSGDPFGTPGATSGDERFGDIRIGAIPLSPEVLAISLPANQTFAGTWAGDVLFNSNATFANSNDLYSVALHEAGHIFGLDHSADPASPMHVHGVSNAVTLTQGDIDNLQTLHGERRADLNEIEEAGGPGDNYVIVPNDTFATATELKAGEAIPNQDATAPAIIYGDIISQDVDFYELEVPGDYSGTLTIEVRTDGISLLAPRVQVYDNNQQLIAEASSFNPAGSLLQLQIIPTTDKLYISIDGATANAFGVGSYSLVATFDGLNTIPQATIDDMASGGAFRFLEADELRHILEGNEEEPFDDDGHTDDTVTSGTRLKTTPGYIDGVHYEVIASISDTTDIDFHTVRSPDLSTGYDTLTLHVESLDATGLIPAIQVYDQNQNALPVTVLANSNGALVAQVTGIAQDADYEIAILAEDTAGPFATGNYELTASFGSNTTTLQTFVQGTLTEQTTEQTHTFYVAETHMFHFLLQFDEAAPELTAGLFATISDANDQTVMEISTEDGTARSAAAVLLTPGTYEVQMTSLTSGGSLSEAGLGYQLLGAAITDPFSIDPIDPGAEAPFRCPDGSGSFCYPDGTVTGDKFWWQALFGATPNPSEVNPNQLKALLSANWWSSSFQDDGSNAAPLTSSDQFEFAANQEFIAAPTESLLVNDVDTNGDLLVVVLNTMPQHGELTLFLNGTFRYKPAPGYSGTDQFTYLAYDFLELSNPETVTLTVAASADFNSDGAVDGSDLAVWQAGFGTQTNATVATGDATGDGDVDGADFLAWQTSYTPPPAATLLASEPIVTATVETPQQIADHLALPLPLRPHISEQEDSHQSEEISITQNRLARDLLFAADIAWREQIKLKEISDKENASFHSRREESMRIRFRPYP